MSEQEQWDDWRNSKPLDAKKYKNFNQLVGGAFVTVVILLIGGFIYSTPEAGYWVNIYATLVGTILTIAVLDRRAEQRATRERKEELILQMGSPDNGFAVEAVRLLRQKGWLTDGSLIDAALQKANLQQADLSGANLQQAHLTVANLQRGDLTRADLQEAVLVGANLQQAQLILANLQGADLSGANLQGADLSGANLQGADLSRANLQQAQLIHAKLQEADLIRADLQQAELRDAYFTPKTRLPDGSNWSPDRDMSEFTNPDEWKAEQAAKQPENPDALQPNHPTPPPPLTFDYIPRKPRPRWRDM